MEKNLSETRNFIVCKSSAGSGKTFTLVKTYLKIALSENSDNPYLYKKILAITFTNKAAAEMKERILKTLRDIKNNELQSGSKNIAEILQNELGISPETLRYRSGKLLEEILHNYADFTVSTIDSFIHRIVRTFAFDLGLPINFSIETDDKEIINQGVDHIISKVGIEKEITELLKEYTFSKIDEQKNWQIDVELKSFLKKILNESNREKLKKIRELTIDDFKRIRFQLKKNKEEFKNQLDQIATNAFNLLVKNQLEKRDIYLGDSGILSFFKKIRAENYLDKKLTHLHPHNNSNIKKTLERKGAWTTETKDLNKIQKILSIQKDLEDLYFEGVKITQDQLPEYILIKAIEKEIFALSLLNEVDKEIDLLKKEKNILFLSEFNLLISKLILEEPVPFIYERMGERFQYYLLDEFQDTSSNQWLNLLPLLINSLSEGKLNLLVGDAKQSIYRWRGGETSQFTDLPALNTLPDFEFKEEWINNLKNNFQSQFLDTNYRSHAEIVKFNNLFFEETVKHIDLPNFNKTFNKHSQNWNTNKEGGLVSIDLIPYESNNEENKSFALVERYIHQNLKLGFQLKDICIIVRKNETGRECANYLTKRGIPIVSSESLWLTNASECNFIIQFLTFLLNPTDSIALATLIHYLREFEKLDQEEEIKFLEEINSRQENSIPFFESILEKLSLKLDLIGLLSLPVLDCCISIIQAFNLEKRNSLYIPFFLEACYEFTIRNSTNCSEFVNWWLEKGYQKSVISSKDSEAVKILSIHASKGLEFPIVILPSMDWKIKNEENLFIDTSGSKVGNLLPTSLVKTSKALEQTEFVSVLKDDEEKQQLDNLNLVYVAFTRAEKHLHIISSERGNHDKSIYDWITQFVENNALNNNRDGTFIFGEALNGKIENKNKTVTNPFEGEFSFRHWNSTIEIKQTKSFQKIKKGIEEKREFGTLVHLLLSKIKNRLKLNEAVESSIQQGLIKRSEKDYYLELLKKIVSHPDLIDCYNPRNKSFNEKDLCDSNGNNFRVDRIVFNEDETILIDFKTGKPNLKDQEQLIGYRDLLLESGKKNVKNILFYIENNSSYLF